MDKFVARENIQHFCDRLKTETDATVRVQLHRLMVEEEDKLGHNSEALQQIDGHIAVTKVHVERQQVLIASIERDGRNSDHVKGLLEAYSETLRAFENQRKKILARLQQPF